MPADFPCIFLALVVATAGVTLFFIVIFIKIVENMNEARDIEVHFATNNAVQWIHGATNVYVQN